MESSRWTVISVSTYRDSRGKRTKLTCRCDCGKIRDIDACSVRSGASKSCGCLRRALGPPNKTHGLAGSPTWLAYYNARQRCINPKTSNYRNYGGRGISMCNRWLLGFDKFLADMGERPFGMTLDRKDNDKGYSKSNCRWVTKRENCLNRSNTKRIRFGHELVTVHAAAERLGIKYKTLWARINRDPNYKIQGYQ